MPNRDNILDDPGMRAYVEGLFPKLRATRFSIILAEDGDPCPQRCLELGAAILLNKPILVLAVKGEAVPPMLRAVAREVVEISGLDDSAGREKMRQAIQRIMAAPS